jgi:hypothetical protein
MFSLMQYANEYIFTRVGCVWSQSLLIIRKPTSQGPSVQGRRFTNDEEWGGVGVLRVVSFCMLPSYHLFQLVVSHSAPQLKTAIKDYRLPTEAAVYRIPTQLSAVLAQTAVHFASLLI